MARSERPDGFSVRIDGATVELHQQPTLLAGNKFTFHHKKVTKRPGRIPLMRIRPGSHSHWPDHPLPGLVSGFGLDWRGICNRGTRGGPGFRGRVKTTLSRPL